MSDGYVSYNKGDYFYQIMYFDIIRPLYDAFGNEDVVKIQQYIKLLLINNKSFFKGENDKKICSEIGILLDKIKTDIGNIMVSSTVQDKAEKTAKKKQMIIDLENALIEIYDLMGKYHMRVFFMDADDRPSVVKRNGR